MSHPMSESIVQEQTQIVEAPSPSLLPQSEVSPLAKAKALGSERWGRIRTILTSAAKATLREAKAGATDVQTLVTESLSPQTQTWGTRVQQAWQQWRTQGRQQFQQAQQKYEQVQQRQAAFETQLETNIGKLGTTVAGKEQQIKRQIKQLLVKTAEKL
jgi:hypothetical protein